MTPEQPSRLSATPDPALPDLLSLDGVRIRTRAAPRLLYAALTRRYAYHGIDTALVLASSIYYALHPGDATHELMKHFGVGDDLLILGLAGRWFNSDLEDFLLWEKTKRPSDDGRRSTR